MKRVGTKMTTKYVRMHPRNTIAMIHYKACKVVLSLTGDWTCLKEKDSFMNCSQST